MRSHISCLIMVLLVFGTGCTTLNSDRNARAREAIRLENLEAEISRLHERVEELAAAQQNLYEQLSGAEKSRRDGDVAVGVRIDRVANDVNALDVKCRSIKQEVVDALSKKIEVLLRSQSPAAQQGREHVVRKGETLSEIAKAYGATVKMIVKANRLKSADSIREGQKLFIPD